MNNGFEPLNCNDNDILSFGDATYKVGKFKKAVNNSFGDSMGRTLTSALQTNGIHLDQNNWSREDYNKWFSDGIDFEILNLGSTSWKKAKVEIKFSLEIYVENEIVETDSINKSEISKEEAILNEIRRLACEE